jgi:hypothetical protein
MDVEGLIALFAIVGTLIPSMGAIVRKFLAARHAERSKVELWVDGDTLNLDVSDAAQAEKLIQAFLERQGDERRPAQNREGQERKQLET